jgi:hypothetical protein
MNFKLMACLSCILAVLAIAHGGLNLAAGREAVWAGTSIATGLAALMVIWLAHRKRRA